MFYKSLNFFCYTTIFAAVDTIFLGGDYFVACFVNFGFTQKQNRSSSITRQKTTSEILVYPLIHSMAPVS